LLIQFNLFINSYGDIRHDILGEIRVLWKALGKKQTAFVSVLVPTLFDLLLTDTIQELKQLALDMFFDMIETECMFFNHALNLYSLHFIF